MTSETKAEKRVRVATEHILRTVRRYLRAIDDASSVNMERALEKEFVGKVRFDDASLFYARNVLAAERRAAPSCPVRSVPAPGEVGLDHKANCAACGKRVSVTKRGLYAPHKAEQRAARRRK